MSTGSPFDRVLYRPRWLMLAGVGMCCLVAAACLFFYRPLKTTVLEVPRSELVLREGRLCLVGETTPFTGVLTERYENGACKSRSSVSNGILHGLSEGWYTNGQRQITEYFTNGVAHGERTKWHENGRLLSQATVLAGKLQGVFRSWAADGSHAQVIEMKDGQPDGLSLAFYPSGFLKAEVRLHDGQVVQSRFWRDGEHLSADLSPDHLGN